MKLRRKNSPVTVEATGPGATPGGAATPRRVFSTETAALWALLAALDNLDVGSGLLGEARRANTRVDRIRGEFAAARQALAERYEHVRTQVIAGTLAPAAALDQLAALAPAEAATEHVAGSLAARLEHDVIAAAEAEAVTAARRDARKVHDTLAKHAEGIVKHTLDAARQVLDLPSYASEVKRAIDAPRWDDNHSRLRGYPHIDLHTVPARQYGAVGQLRSARAELEAVHDAARLLRALCPTLDTGAGSVLYKNPPARAAEGYVQRWTPPELVVPIAHELGWKPGLWLRSESKPRPDTHDTGKRPRMPGDHGEQLITDLTRAAVADVSAGGSRVFH